MDLVIADTDDNCELNQILATRKRKGQIRSLLYLIGCYCALDRRRQLIQLGIDGIYIKPIDFDELMFDIERVLLKKAV